MLWVFVYVDEFPLPAGVFSSSARPTTHGMVWYGMVYVWTHRSFSETLPEENMTLVKSKE